jgi:hypothetical protein
LIAVLAGGVIALGAAAPVSAELVDRGHRHTIESELIEDFCGIDGFNVIHTLDWSGSFTVTTRGPDGFVQVRDSVRESNSFLNPQTGKNLTALHLGHGHDMSITDNGDGTLTVIFQNSGLDTLFDGNGDKVLSVAGVTRDEFLIDNNGTPHDPSDDQFLEYVARIKTWPNNAFEGRDFCEDFFLFTA